MALWAFLDSDSNDRRGLFNGCYLMFLFVIQNVFLYAIYILNSNAKLINPILPSVQTSNLGGVLYEEILGKFFTTPLMTWTLL